LDLGNTAVRDKVKSVANNNQLKEVFDQYAMPGQGRHFCVDLQFSLFGAICKAFRKNINWFSAKSKSKLKSLI